MIVLGRHHAGGAGSRSPRRRSPGCRWRSPAAVLVSTRDWLGASGTTSSSFSTRSVLELLVPLHPVLAASSRSSSTSLACRSARFIPPRPHRSGRDRRRSRNSRPWRSCCVAAGRWCGLLAARAAAVPPSARAAAARGRDSSLIGGLGSRRCIWGLTSNGWKGQASCWATPPNGHGVRVEDSEGAPALARPRGTSRGRGSGCRSSVGRAAVPKSDLAGPSAVVMLGPPYPLISPMSRVLI